MKALIKLAAAGLLVVIATELGRQWQRTRKAPTLRPVEDAEPHQGEPLEPEDLRVAQNSPL